MKLFECEAKRILKQFGIAFPDGELAHTVEEAGAVAGRIGKPVVVKAQVLVSGRGKAGGVLFADNVAEAKNIAAKLIGSKIKDAMVHTLLVEEKIDIAQQMYTSIAIDRQRQTYVVLASLSGGVNIEEVAKTSPEKIVRHIVDFEKGFDEAEAKKLVRSLDIPAADRDMLSSILSTLYKAIISYDAELVELNPLVKLPSGAYVAADARMIIDDNALFRHVEFKDRVEDRIDDTPREAEARKLGLAYVDLNGDIGIIGNGAGLTMATVDVVNIMGGKPTNFLDIGGGAKVDVIRDAVTLVMSKPGVKAVLVNILGGITRCDIVAQGVIAGMNASSEKKPVAVRMVGTNEEEGNRMLREVGITAYANMEEAIARVITL